MKLAAVRSARVLRDTDRRSPSLVCGISSEVVSGVTILGGLSSIGP